MAFIGLSGSVRPLWGYPRGQWELRFHRVSDPARPRRPAHAKQDGWSTLLPTNMSNSLLVSALAKVFLAGEPAVEQIVARGNLMFGRRWRWLRPLAQRYLRAYDGQTRPRHREVVHFLLADRGFGRARRKYSNELLVAQWLTEPQQMQRGAAATKWDVPIIESVTSLADWLGLSVSELEWFADLKGLERGRKDCPQLKHYHYRIFSKRSGSIRLIESPKPRLKELQRRILNFILDEIPLHSAAHGFRRGRSIKTFTAPHVGQRVLLRMDLENFFPSISGARVQALFRTIGYPERIADLLGGICTNTAPRDIWIAPDRPECAVSPHPLRETRALYARPHLPQGAPTSPSLANLCSYRMDCRLAGVAKSVGASYTRYADDLAFSGDEGFERCVDRFSTHVAAILHEEGFAANHHKTRVMRQSVRQSLTGLVVNQCVNVRRNDFDRLKATLTNCVRLGPQSQNRDAYPNFRSHLEGQVGFIEMINPVKAKRLRRILEQIEWQ
jgi:RNA-directed DNA polymerase